MDPRLSYEQQAEFPSRLALRLRMEPMEIKIHVDTVTPPNKYRTVSKIITLRDILKSLGYHTLSALHIPYAYAAQ